jgi:hypothetical protein
VTGSQIPNLIAPLLMTEKPGDEQLAKWKRLFNAVAIKQNEQKDGRPLIRVVSGVMTPVRFECPAEFDTARARQREAAAVGIQGAGGRQGRQDSRTPPRVRALLHERRAWAIAHSAGVRMKPGEHSTAPR